MKTPLGLDVLLLERFDGKESISQPFEFHLHMISTSKNLDLTALINQSITLYVRLADHTTYRAINGKCRSARQLELDMGLTTYQLEMVPWLWFLTQKTNCRFFLDKTIPEILEQVFGENGGTFRLSLTRGYEKRKYCVQFRETDYNFVSRLMEEEGIFYYWEQSEDSHTMVLADAPGSVKPCPHQSKYKYAYQIHPDHPEDFVHSVDFERSYKTGKVMLAEFDFTKQYDPFTASVSGKYAQSEKYDFPGYRWNGPGMDKYARDWLEMEEWPEDLIRGHSTARPFTPGYKIDLSEHFNGAINRSYLILAVYHRAEGNNYRSELEEPFRYTNTYEAMPSATPFRPPRLAIKPTIKGTQTAIVVTDAAGEEIFPDKYGRVKVRFHWDREKKNSCWIRVSQSWAGLAWGWITIPRVGQEVVVSYMEGDPDRPLITGRVYDEMQPVPYKLPDHKTVSTWKSRSSKGGGAKNFNEIRMEDLKGQEQLFIHAEFQRDDYTKKEMREWVGASRHLLVMEDQKEEIKKNKHLKVASDQVELIGSKYSLKVGSDYHIKVGTNYALDAGMEVHIKAGMKVIIEAGMQVSLKGAGGFVDIGPAGVTIQGTMVLINSGGAAGSGSGSSPATPEPPDKADDGTKFTKL
ncbi:MAG TPA: type VI secretion system tip protein TssI/VgrG [Bryobacteraceae bacterium]|nr:type VI secretion system tip protein TssI/VgrG [Bryobacteraceae bacterium]